MAGHPFDCEPDERVTLAWRGNLKARDAVREAVAMPLNLRGLVIIFRQPDKTPNMLSFEQAEQLSRSPGFLEED